MEQVVCFFKNKNGYGFVYYCLLTNRYLSGGGCSSIDQVALAFRYALGTAKQTGMRMDNMVKAQLPTSRSSFVIKLRDVVPSDALDVSSMESNAIFAQIPELLSV